MDVAAERLYPTPYANSPLLPLLLLSLAIQRNAPKTTKNFNKEYDFVIVGGGSAGSVVAGRLSEIPNVSVLLLEAGKSPPLLTEVPALARHFLFTDLDWNYTTVPQKHTGNGLINRQTNWSSGKGLGGSSLISGSVYVRGAGKVYDDWAEKHGAVGWKYEDVLPYFMKLEDNRDIEFLANGNHSVGGPVTVEKPRYTSEIKHAIIEASEKLGYKLFDPNAESEYAPHIGIYDLQAIVRFQQRCSAAKSYLVPAEDRTNLHILPNAFVTKIITQNREAKGVEFEYLGGKYVVNAKREVIMAAGVTNTPQLLMLSGIGPKEHLQKFNIPVVADLPVGNNLQDHGAAINSYQLDPSIPTVKQKLEDPNNVHQYINERSGILASAQFISAVAFKFGLKHIPEWPCNFQIHFMELPDFLPRDQLNLKPEVYRAVYGPYENKPKYACVVNHLQPASRGTVRLQSVNPHDPPLIDPNYFNQPTDMDDIVEGLKLCNKIAAAESMRKVGTQPFKTAIPGCEQFLDDEDKYLRCKLRSYVISLPHGVGTAKMGDVRNATTVVDPFLRVKGVKNLRIVDASVMPIIPAGNTYIPVVMVAEKASDLIKQTINCPGCPNPNIPGFSNIPSNLGVPNYPGFLQFQ